MYIDFNRIRIGDRLVRTKGGFLSKHHALYVGFSNNCHWIAENQYGYGVRYIPLNQFLNEGILKRIEYNNFSRSSQRVILDRVDERMGLPYDFFNYCGYRLN